MLLEKRKEGNIFCNVWVPDEGLGEKLKRSSDHFWLNRFFFFYIRKSRD